MCLYTERCKHAHVRTHIKHTCKHANMHAHISRTHTIHIHTHTHTHTPQTHTYIHTYTHTHTHTSKQTQTQMHQLTNYYSQTKQTHETQLTGLARKQRADFFVMARCRHLHAAFTRFLHQHFQSFRLAQALQQHLLEDPALLRVRLPVSRSSQVQQPVP